MSKQTKNVHTSPTKTAKKQTALDKFTLFYEEIPMKIEVSNNESKPGKNERLVRRSRS